MIDLSGSGPRVRAAPDLGHDVQLYVKRTRPTSRTFHPTWNQAFARIRSPIREAWRGNFG